MPSAISTRSSEMPKQKKLQEKKPKQEEKALFARWVPQEHAAAAIEAGFVSHNHSAMWIFDLSQTYRPGNGITKNSCLIAYELDATATHNVKKKTLLHKNFEDDDFGGESKWPNHIIVKRNEPGAYGVGKHRQKTTNYHVKTRYATRQEVAKALGLNEREVDVYKPPTGWSK